MDIFEPLQLSRGSHQAGSGKGCAMNVISWENGDTKITDYPECSDRMLARLVQGVNDSLADADGYLNAENSLIALDLGHATVGTAYHSLSDVELRQVYVSLAIYAARKVVHLAKTPTALAAIEAAERWVDEPSEKNAVAAAYAAYAVADADAAYAAAVYAAAYAPYAGAGAAYAVAAADAAADAADAADAVAKGIEFKIELAWELIAKFKELTGTHSPEPVEEVVACAVRNMTTVNA